MESSKDERSSNPPHQACKDVYQRKLLREVTYSNALGEGPLPHYDWPASLQLPQPWIRHFASTPLTLISLIVQILKLTHHVKEYQIGKLLPGKLIYISETTERPLHLEPKKQKKNKKGKKRGLRFSFSTKHQAHTQNFTDAGVIPETTKYLHPVCISAQFCLCNKVRFLPKYIRQCLQLWC